MQSSTVFVQMPSVHCANDASVKTSAPQCMAVWYAARITLLFFDVSQKVKDHLGTVHNPAALGGHGQEAMIARWQTRGCHCPSFGCQNTA